MDSFDTQIQCEEVYGDEACAQFMLEQAEQREVEDVNTELSVLFNSNFDWTHYQAAYLR